MENAQVYVGTYSKYNNGYLSGAWLQLEDYISKDDFLEACERIHSDEKDPEFMFQDWENIPDYFISESGIDAEFWEFLEHQGDYEAKCAYIDAFNEWDGDNFDDRYRGEYESDVEFAEEFAEETCMLEGVPENLRCYFDYEAFARDLMMDFTEFNGHYFWNC